MEIKRFLLVVIGQSNGIKEDLDELTDERGVHFIDGPKLFLCTFYSPYTTTQLHEKLINRPAFMIFDITDSESNGINLPEKYFKGLFPETEEFEEYLNSIQNMDEEVEEVVKEKEHTNVNQILDKLSKNNYDRSCLTKNELDILKNYN